MPRPIDHLVIAVRDLDAARAGYARLGFTLTPRSVHPFGTANSLVQLDGAYLELLGIADPEKIPAGTATSFSFAAFNRDFLAKHEGLSMLVLSSRDAEADRADFAAHGLRSFAPAHFSRTALGADGVPREVAFSLAHIRDPAIDEAGFLACQHHFPENFWQPRYQEHANSARTVQEVVLLAMRPEDHRAFLEAFTGGRAAPAPGGFAIETGRGRVTVVSAEDADALARFGRAGGHWLRAAGGSPRLIAATIGVTDMAALHACLEASEIPHDRVGETSVVPAAATHGVVLAFTKVALSAPGR